MQIDLVSWRTDAAIVGLWQTGWDLTEGVLGRREYRSTSRDTLSCPCLVARSIRPPSGTAGQWSDKPNFHTMALPLGEGIRSAPAAQPGYNCNIPPT
eukprot:360737-Chlamydomonas_euryale.AAC.1